MRLMVSVLTITLVIAFAVSAQADVCTAIVRAAVESTALECADVQIGEACYGSAALEIETADDNAFTRPGDVTNITAVESLRSRSLDVESGEWGVAVMRAQANAPEQHLFYAVFGDVNLNSTATESEAVR